MILNERKCELFNVGKFNLSSGIQVDDHTIESVEHATYLGLIISKIDV